MSRGRPKHDDVLTPREWQVLALLREGLTNEVIAVRLGISPETAKFHVAEILGKLGVSSRHEAARWPGRARRRAFWLPWPARLVAATAAIALVVLLAVTIVAPRWLASGRTPDREPGVEEDAALAGRGLDEGTPGAFAAPVPAGLVVCAEDDAWQKPSIEQQVAQMQAIDPHSVIYGGFSDMHRSQFAASFWFPPTGADFAGLVIEFSGLWTEPDTAHTWSSGCPLPAGADWMDVRYAWLLGYKATSAAYTGDQLVVQVEAKPLGFQIVMLRFHDAVFYAGTADFVDPLGRVIERTGMRYSITGAQPDCTCLAVWSIKP